LSEKDTERVKDSVFQAEDKKEENKEITKRISTAMIRKSRESFSSLVNADNEPLPIRTEIPDAASSFAESAAVDSRKNRACYLFY
jgi:hypothetical protein